MLNPAPAPNFDPSPDSETVRPHWLHAFVRARLARGAYLGLHLTIGAIITLVAGWAFGVIAEDVMASAAIVEIDEHLAAWFNAHATPFVIGVAKVATFLGGGIWVTLTMVLLSLVLIRQRHWYRLAALVLTVGGGSLVNVILKHYFERPRPEVENPILHLSTYSFPSGHTISATLLYGVLALYIAQRTRSWTQRIVAALAGVTLIFLVALSRVCLGVHYLSDVLGAICVGLMWLAACVTGIEVIRRRKEK